MAAGAQEGSAPSLTPDPAAGGRGPGRRRSVHRWCSYLKAKTAVCVLPSSSVNVSIRQVFAHVALVFQT